MSADVGRSRVLMRIAARGIFGLACMDAILFGLAGRTDWRSPWVVTFMFAVLFLLGGGWFLRHDPDLLQERMSTAPNVPRWDRLLMRVYSVVLLGLFVAADLDAGRFRWSHVPLAVQAAGMVSVLAAFVVIWWCTAVNHFLSSRARIQTERGHVVVRDGPYRYVRHPMYTSIIVLMIGMALALGSWLAVVPAVLIGVLFVVRTLLEDRMLADGLDGYRAYVKRVPRRLVPGLW